MKPGDLVMTSWTDQAWNKALWYIGLPGVVLEVDSLLVHVLFENGKVLPLSRDCEWGFKLEVINEDQQPC